VLEGLLAIVGLEMMTESVCRAGGREFQILGAATWKLRAPSEVWTNEMESRLIGV